MEGVPDFDFHEFVGKCEGTVSGQYVNLLLDRLDGLQADWTGATMSSEWKRKERQLRQARNREWNEINKLRKDLNGVFATVREIGGEKSRMRKIDAALSKGTRWMERHTHQNHDTKESVRSLMIQCRDLMDQKKKRIQEKKKDQDDTYKKIETCMCELKRVMSVEGEAETSSPEIIGQNSFKGEVKGSSETNQNGVEQAHLRDGRQVTASNQITPAGAKRNLLLISVLGVVIYIVFLGWQIYEKHSNSPDSDLNRYIGEFITKESKPIQAAILLLMLIYIVWQF